MINSNFELLFLRRCAREFLKLSQNLNWDTVMELEKKGDKNFEAQEGIDEFSYWADENVDIRALTSPYPDKDSDFHPEICFRVLRPNLVAGVFLSVEEIVKNNSSSEAMQRVFQRNFVIDTFEIFRAKMENIQSALPPEFIESVFLSLSINCLRILETNSFLSSRKSLTRAFCDPYEIKESGNYFFSYDKTVDPKVMKTVSEKIEPRGIAIVPSRTFDLNADGTCHLRQDSVSVCYGVLWELPPEIDPETLRSSISGQGHCAIEEVTVEILNKRINASTFNSTSQGKVGHLANVRKTVDHILQGILHFHGHPEWGEYVMLLSEIFEGRHFEAMSDEERVLN